MTGPTRAQVAAIAEQIGSELMPDKGQWKYRFTVPSTSSSAVYTVAVRRSDGTWGCSCPSWRNRRRCRHLTDILGRLTSLIGNLDDAELAQDDSVLQLLRSARTAFLDLGEVIPVTVFTPRFTRDIDL